MHIHNSFFKLDLEELAVFNIRGIILSANKWMRMMCIHSQPLTSLRQKMAFEKKGLYFVKRRIV